MYLDSPFFGQGPNMYRKKCSDKKFFIEQSSCTTHPHNFLLQMLAEIGLFGSLFYLFIFFIILRTLLSLFYETKIKKVELTNYKLKMFIINMGFIINSFVFILPNGNFFNNYLNAIIFIPVGFYLFQKKMINDLIFIFILLIVNILFFKFLIKTFLKLKIYDEPDF